MSEKKLTLVVLGGLSIAVLLACQCGNPAPPPSDGCSAPSNGHIDSVEFATPRIDSERYSTSAALIDLPPRMLSANDPVWLINGGQGAAMVPVQLVLRGTDLPSCISHDTQVTVDGALAARNRDSVSTYAYENGARITRPIWLPGASAGTAMVTSDVGGKRPSLPIHIEWLTECEKAGHCPCKKALECDCSTPVSGGAGASLWQAVLDCRAGCDGGGCEADGGSCEASVDACQADPY